MAYHDRLGVRTLVWGIAVGSLIGVAAHAAAAATETPNADLLRAIERSIEGYAHFTVFDHVTVDIDHEGIAVLGGWVTAHDKRRDIAHRVSTVGGIVGVQNDIDVLPSSRFDNELRYYVARSIYGSATFWPYAARRNPPIHVIVEGGHVTLVGQVDSDADRAMAGILASHSAALSLTNALELRRDARKPPEPLD